MSNKAVRENHPHITEERFYILCPGCYEVYKQRYPDDSRFWINGAVHCFSTQIHQFNYDMEKPTLSPSLLFQYPFNDGSGNHVCHSYVKEGMIQFLGDCTHPLANQTLELMDVSLLDTPAPEKKP